MGIADELGYRFRTPNPFQRLMQLLGATSLGAKVFKVLLPRMDTLLGRITRGRYSAPGVLAALPVLDVVTTGRKSGQPRRTHLIAVPHADTLALLGTNFGQKATPAWVFNLEADPSLRVTYRGTTVAALARPATAEEQAAVLARSERIYPGYRAYQKRISGRTLRIFLLEPAGSRA